MSVDGMDEVLRNLSKLEQKLAGPAKRAGLLAAANEAKKHVMINARQEFYEGDYSESGALRQLTGNLLGSIQTRMGTSDDTSVLSVGADYGGYLEMGTSRGIRARHYVLYGVTRHVSEIRRAFIQSARKKLKL